MTTSESLATSISPDTEDDAFMRDAWQGLARPAKTMPSKYLYDKQGSALFERICETPEYYLTRVELALMEAHADAIADALGKHVRLVEFGNGAGVKTRLLLSALQSPACYVPVEISESALSASCRDLRTQFPSLDIQPLQADFTQALTLPRGRAMPASTTVYLAGSTLGNFDATQAAGLLRQMRRTAGAGGAVLLGLDLKKSPTVLNAAYNDAQGVTARFTLNLLARINRELDADFDLSRFAHRAEYSEDRGCIETDIVSLQAQSVRVAGRRFEFRQGEAIRVEVSCKYSREDIARLATEAGLRVRRLWTDDDGYFAVMLLDCALI